MDLDICMGTGMDTDRGIRMCMDMVMDTGMGMGRGMGTGK